MANTMQSGLFTAGRVEWLSQGVWRTVAVGYSAESGIHATFVEDVCVLLGFHTGHALPHGSLGAGSLNISVLRDSPSRVYNSDYANFSARSGHGLINYFSYNEESSEWGRTPLALNCSNAPGEVGCRMGAFMHACRVSPVDASAHRSHSTHCASHEYAWHAIWDWGG